MTIKKTKGSDLNGEISQGLGQFEFPSICDSINKISSIQATTSSTTTKNPFYTLEDNSCESQTYVYRVI